MVNATWAWGWRWIILLGASATAFLALIDASGPIRALVTVGFLVVCPGMSLTRLIDLRDTLAEMALAIAISVALTGLVGGFLLYFGIWSPGAGSAILVAIALGALAADPLVERRRVGGVVRGLATRDLGATSAGASQPVVSNAASTTVQEPEAAAHPSVLTAPGRPPAGLSAALGGEPRSESLAPDVRRKRHETAPDFLLRTPTSAIQVSDEFFAGLVRPREGDH